MALAEERGQNVLHPLFAVCQARSHGIFHAGAPPSAATTPRIRSPLRSGRLGQVLAGSLLCADPGKPFLAVCCSAADFFINCPGWMTDSSFGRGAKKTRHA
eukprot:478467-Rhodomonas_salina.4